jgi:hypothetical protein
MGVCWLALASVSSAAFVTEDAGTWGNQMLTPDAGATYSFDLASMSSCYYQYSQALGVADAMWVDADAGQTKIFVTKFEFSQAIASFNFVTPNTLYDMTEVWWQYSLNGTDWTEFMHRPATGEFTSYAPERSAEQSLGIGGVTRLYLAYVAAPGFAGQVYFYPGAGQLNVTTVPEPMTLAMLAVGGVSCLRRRV